MGFTFHSLYVCANIPKGQSESLYRRRTDNAMAKEKAQKDKQRSTKHTYKTKDRVTRTLLKTGGELQAYQATRGNCTAKKIHSYTRCQY